MDLILQEGRELLKLLNKNETWQSCSTRLIKLVVMCTIDT